MNTPGVHYHASAGHSLTCQPSLRASLSEESCLAQVHSPKGGMSQRLPGSFIPWQDSSERPPPGFRSSTGSAEAFAGTASQSNFFSSLLQVSHLRPQPPWEDLETAP